MFAKVLPGTLAVPILEVTKLSLYTCIESVVQAEIRNVTELKRRSKATSVVSGPNDELPQMRR